MYQTRLMKFLDQVNQLFFSKRYFDSESGVVENDSRGLPSTWVLSRSFCAYYCLDFTNVEESKKHVALENRLEVCSPFSNFGYWVAWKDGIAQVWVWEQERIQESIRSTVLEAQDENMLNVVPESIFFASLDEGLQCFRSEDGFVIQNWRGGVLADERFWPSVPNDLEKNKFVHGVGRNPNIDIPEIDREELPWSGHLPPIKVVRAFEPSFVLASVLVMALVLGYQCITWISMSFALAMLEDDVEETRDAIQDAVELRKEAYEKRDRVTALIGLREEPSLQLMLDIGNGLPGIAPGSGQIMKWDQKGEDLRIIIDKPAAALEKYAAAFDRADDLADVSLVPNDRIKILTVRARVVK